MEIWEENTWMKGWELPEEGQLGRVLTRTPGSLWSGETRESNWEPMSTSHLLSGHTQEVVIRTYTSD